MGRQSRRAEFGTQARENTTLSSPSKQPTPTLQQKSGCLTGRTLSDRYAGYAHIAPERRQLCWSHYLGCGFILGSGGELEAGSGAGRRATPDKASLPTAR